MAEKECTHENEERWKDNVCLDCGAKVYICRGCSDAAENGIYHLPPLCKGPEDRPPTFITRERAADLQVEYHTGLPGYTTITVEESEEIRRLWNANPDGNSSFYTTVDAIRDGHHSVVEKA